MSYLGVAYQRHGGYDCRSNYVGYCLALVDTDFGDRQCPFYKTSKQYYEEIYERKNNKKNTKRMQKGGDF